MNPLELSKEFIKFRPLNWCFMQAIYNLYTFFETKEHHLLKVRLM